MPDTAGVFCEEVYSRIGQLKSHLSTVHLKDTFEGYKNQKFKKDERDDFYINIKKLQTDMDKMDKFSHLSPKHREGQIKKPEILNVILEKKTDGEGSTF